MTDYHHAPSLAAPVPPPARQRTSAVLVVLAVTLFVAAALLATLHVLTDRDHDAALTLLDTLTAELADVRGRVTTTDTQRAAAQSRVDDLTDTNAELTACVEAVQRYLWDGLAGDERDAALDTMFDACQ